MKRHHFFEWEDQAWFPKLWRDLLTDFLAMMQRVLVPYDPCLPLLRQLLASTGQTRVVDLCAGAGGPWESWLRRGWVSRVLLTDLYPNLPAWQAMAARYPALEYHAEPVDAAAVPAGLPGLRTLFTAIHHLRPEQVRSLLRDAAEAGQPLAAFDFNQRNWLNLVLIPSLALPTCWLLTPFIRPFRWQRWLFTYLLPVVPLAAAWDGLVSQLRSYHAHELRALAPELPGYRWEAGRLSRFGLFHLTYLIGRPES